MTTFNGCPYVDSQLASIAAQTRPPNEIVIGDDQSTDATAQVVEAFARSHPHITVRFERNNERLGTTRNFERVIRRCTGDVVVFADQDDLWMPTRLARVAEIFVANPEVTYVFSNGLLINGEGRPLSGTLFSGLDFTAEEKARYINGKAFEVLLRHNVITGAALAVKREHLIRVLPFQPNWLHDYYLAFALEIVGRGLLIEEPLIRYRCHRAQQVGIAGQGSIGKILAYARKQNETYCHQEATHFRALRNQLMVLGTPLDHPLLAALSEKSSFIEMRARMRAAPLQTPTLIWQAWRRGYYTHYALGWKQVVVDTVAALLAAMRQKRMEKFKN